MISIIIATYNRAHLLPRSIDSILCQTYSDWELIVIDDGSTDDTQLLFENRYKDPRIMYIRLDTNHGATYARNYGLAKMSGEYFIVWDSDDSLYPHALEQLVEVFKKHPVLAVVSAPARTIRYESEIPYKRVPTGILPHDAVLCRILPPSNDKVKLVNSGLCGDIRYKSKNIDFLVNVEFGKRGEWWHIDEYLGDVYVESDGMSLTRIRKKPNIRMSIDRARYLVEYLDETGDIMKAKYPKQYAAFAYGASLGLLLDCKRSAARQLMWQSCVYSCGTLKYVLLYVLTLLPFAPLLLSWLFRLKRSWMELSG